MVNKPGHVKLTKTKIKSPCKSNEKVVKQMHCDALEEMMCPKCFHSISRFWLFHEFVFTELA